MNSRNSDADDTACDIPTNSSDLDVQSLLDLAEIDRGEELWVPVSFVRGNTFRAVKVRVLNRVSVGNFEEINAVDPWPQSDRYPTDHEITEGINCPLSTELKSECEDNE